MTYVQLLLPSSKLVLFVDAVTKRCHCWNAYTKCWKNMRFETSLAPTNVEFQPISTLLERKSETSTLETGCVAASNIATDSFTCRRIKHKNCSHVVRVGRQTCDKTNVSVRWLSAMFWNEDQIKVVRTRTGIWNITTNTSTSPSTNVSTTAKNSGTKHEHGH